MDLEVRIPRVSHDRAAKEHGERLEGPLRRLGFTPLSAR
jgi:hypothetical protein